MLSESEPVAPGTDASPLSVPPDGQVLLEADGRGSPLAHLPDDAVENLLVVTTGDRPAEVEAAVSRRRDDVRTVGVVPITSTVLGYDGPLWTTERVPPNDLTGISIRISQGFSNLTPGRGWLVFDCISTLLMYAEENRVYRLLDWIVGNARTESVRGVYTIQPGVVADGTCRRFRGLCDDVTRR